MALTLFAGAGILAVVIGFAAQKAFSNIISGIFIVTFKPFRVGDLIKRGKPACGTVEDITLRHTVIVTFENRRLIIPNSMISDEVIVNSSIKDESTCEFVEVELALQLTLNCDRLVQHHAVLHGRIEVRTSPTGKAGEAITGRCGAGERGALMLRAYVWAKDPVTARRMHYDLNEASAIFDEKASSPSAAHRRSIQSDHTRANPPHHEEGPQ